MTSGKDRPLMIVAGPTASGKSELAVRLAERHDGIVVNADAVQVYDRLRILTARPSPEQEARAPHRLYGVLPPTEICSAGRWRALAVAECEAAWAAGKLPIVTGGTGLYLRALTQGLAPIPDIPEEIRARTRERFAMIGVTAFHAALALRDREMARQIGPTNSQRLMRAWEILEATGRSQAEWHAMPAEDTLACQSLTLLLMPPAAPLRAACDARFLAMLKAGAMEETKSLLALDLDPALPAMKALGVPQLAAFLNGEITLAEATEQAQRATRHYAKRQITWFRHQLVADITAETQFSESLTEEIFSKVREFLLT